MKGADAPASPPTNRVVDIMEMLAVEPDRPLSLAQICRAQGITRATGHSILATLVERGWVLRDDAVAAYSLGRRLNALMLDSRPPGRRLERLMRNLSRDLDAPVSLATMRGQFLVITDTVAPPSTPQRVPTGLALPFVAPFGREYVAWAEPAARERWLDTLPRSDRDLQTRIDAVLSSIRERGFVVDRLSRPLVRVYAALRALGDDVVVDDISTAVAGAYAGLATVDVTDDELQADGEALAVATISVPIVLPGGDGSVTMSLTAQPFARLTPPEITRVGATLTAARAQAEAVLAEGQPAVEH